MAEKNQLLILHSIPGRVRFRYKAKGIKIPDVGKLLEISGIEEVVYNKTTQSLVILYNEKILSLTKLKTAVLKKIPSVNIVQARGKSKEADSLFSDSSKDSRLLQDIYEATKNIDVFFRKGVDVAREKLKKVDSRAPVSDKGSRLFQEVYKVSKDVDTLFRKGTKDKADIPSLIASALVLTGIVDLFRRPELPSWDDLIWYGINMFYWQSKRDGEKQKSKGGGKT